GGASQVAQRRGDARRAQAVNGDLQQVERSVLIMFLFLLGILADETFRRLIVPFFRRHPEHVERLRALRHAAARRVHLAGELDGVADVIGALGVEQTDPIDTSDMHYMDREGPSEIDGGEPPDDAGAESAVPFVDVAGASPLDGLRDKIIARAQDKAAEAIVDNFASEMLSGCLGAVDQEVRDRLARHLEWHRRREGAVAGFHIPGLNAARRIGSVAWKLDPAHRIAAAAWKRLDAPIPGGGGGGRAPGPQPDGGGDAPPDGGDAPADA